MVHRRVEGSRGEETVVEEGAFEYGMNEEVEGVPDEEDAKTERCSLGEDAAGETVGGIEDHQHGEKADGRCLVKVFDD